MWGDVRDVWVMCGGMCRCEWVYVGMCECEGEGVGLYGCAGVWVCSDERFSNNTDHICTFC